VQSVSRILGKDASNYGRVRLGKDRSRSILIGDRKGNDYSQFHFGAGEASIIEMVTKIEDSADNSLILIEEIENGLHPLATKKMVEYLFDVAERKKSQVIFTTHSEYALSILPPKAIWACIDGVAYQGALNIESLRALTGNISKNRVIFVEDDFAKDLCGEVIRQHRGDYLQTIEIHKAGGYPYVVEVLKHHNDNPTIKTKAIAIIDGDNPPLSPPNEDILVLPNGSPESVVYSFIEKNAEEIASLIQQRCQCPSVSQDRIVEHIRGVHLDTTDHHLYFAKLGDRLGFISELVVRRGLCSIYVEKCEAQFSDLLSGLDNRLGFTPPQN
ncbi:MAG: ATP-binding protein, partial [Defluviimonas sp.]|nr:ATP-binding protein [Defluviimonas sp.]